ncbi:226_t:CDS:2 [Entrophospora sp. SA101]|nr:226_t:CDS:2 [Entrophospora sp. SA101]
MDAEINQKHSNPIIIMPQEYYYTCCWKDCNLVYREQGKLLNHCYTDHIISLNENLLEYQCHWNSCKGAGFENKVGLFYHLRDTHLSFRLLEQKSNSIQQTADQASKEGLIQQQTIYSNSLNTSKHTEPLTNSEKIWHQNDDKIRMTNVLKRKYAEKNLTLSSKIALPKEDQIIIIDDDEEEEINNKLVKSNNSLLTPFISTCSFSTAATIKNPVINSNNLAYTATGSSSKQNNNAVNIDKSQTDTQQSHSKKLTSPQLPNNNQLVGNNNSSQVAINRIYSNANDILHKNNSHQSLRILPQQIIYNKNDNKNNSLVINIAATPSLFSSSLQNSSIDSQSSQSIQFQTKNQLSQNKQQSIPNINSSLQTIAEKNVQESFHSEKSTSSLSTNKRSDDKLRSAWADLLANKAKLRGEADAEETNNETYLTRTRKKLNAKQKVNNNNLNEFNIITKGLVCEWESCNKVYRTRNHLKAHMIAMHLGDVLDVKIKK